MIRDYLECAVLCLAWIVLFPVASLFGLRCEWLWSWTERALRRWG